MLQRPDSEPGYSRGVTDTREVRPEHALVQAMAAARQVRSLLRENHGRHTEIARSLADGLTVGPLVIH